jgi:CDP-paratose 2-epimerase
VVGALEWFVPGEYDRVERVAAGLRELGIEHLRTGVSWADWYTEHGEPWYDWLLPRLAREFEVLPCVVYTPPSLGVVEKAAAPPRRPRDYADFLDYFIDRHGTTVEWIELWNEPNNIAEWDWRLDLSWNAFTEMIDAAAYWVRQRGRKAVLGGMSPLDPNWLGLLASRGALEHVSAVGIHGFPGTWEVAWQGWDHVVDSVRTVMDEHRLDPEIWITEAGLSTWKNNEWEQTEEFLSVLDAPVSRVYWYSAEDLHPERETVGGFHTDIRHYHMGLRHDDGRPKLLARLLANGGEANVREVARLARPRPLGRVSGPRALITGGAGFIGTNLADRLLGTGRRVRILDNLARAGVERNLRWLRARHGDGLEIVLGDIRDELAVRRAVAGTDEVFHLAAQVAVTTSLDDPKVDFGVNVQGTVRLLEELRRLPQPPPLLFTSTNKVYGSLPDLDVVRDGDRWLPVNECVRARGLDERTPLRFCTPYGCSKGAADQYVLDHAASFGLETVVFRMSCIYGPHQHGTEDQGWVAHFVLRTLANEPVTLYGDGAQVRDILFVDDLLDAILLAREGIERLSGQAFNIGGGPQNAVSLLEVIGLITELDGRKPELRFASTRHGDQHYYVSDTSRFRAATGWQPTVDVKTGLGRVMTWLTYERPQARPAVAARGRT